MKSTKKRGRGERGRERRSLFKELDALEAREREGERAGCRQSSLPHSPRSLSALLSSPPPLPPPPSPSRRARGARACGRAEQTRLHSKRERLLLRTRQGWEGHAKKPRPPNTFLQTLSRQSVSPCGGGLRYCWLLSSRPPPSGNTHQQQSYFEAAAVMVTSGGRSVV